MSYIDPELDEPDETPDGDESNDLRNLRRKAKEHDKLARENEQLRADMRELEFVRAGIDTSTPMGQMFLKAYDGESSADAIKTAWEAVSGGTLATEDPDRDAQIAEETKERQNLAAGATGDDGELPVVPVRGKEGRAVRAGLDAIQTGLSHEDAQGVAFASLVAAAASGDRSVIVGGEQA